MPTIPSIALIAMVLPAPIRTDKTGHHSRRNPQIQRPQDEITLPAHHPLETDRVLPRHQSVDPHRKVLLS